MEAEGVDQPIVYTQNLEMIKDLYINVEQDLIVVTAERVKLTLMEAHGELASRERWQAPAGIFVALSTALATADFKKTFGVEAAVIEAMAILVALSALFFTIRALIQRAKAVSVEDIVQRLQRQSMEASGDTND